MHGKTGTGDAQATPAEPRRLAPVLRWLLWLVGAIALALGLIGVVLPGLPTTPFVLLAAACFARASPRLHLWMRNNRWIGPSLQDWEQHHSLTLRIKIVALVSMAVMVGFSLWTFRGNLPVQAALAAGAAAGIWVVAWRIPTRTGARNRR